MALAELLTFEVATPVGLALQTECESVAAPSVDGEFGVFPGHLPLLAAVRSGVIAYVVDGKTRLAAVGPGFIEAGPDKVLLLTESFVRPDEVDIDEAQAELDEAEARLGAMEAEYGSHEHEELVRDVGWAQARIAAAERVED